MNGDPVPSQVLKEIAECRKAYPQCYVRLAAFDSVKQVQVISFLVQRPGRVAMAAMSGEKEMKVWNPINNKKFEARAVPHPHLPPSLSPPLPCLLLRPSYAPSSPPSL